jgi:ketosteroid isomerase-like protein
MTHAIGRWLLVLALGLPLVAGAQATGAVEKEIANLEQVFNAAYLANDLPKYFAFYADDLVALFPEGRTDLKSYRAEWTDFIKKGNRLVANTITDLVVRAGPSADEATASYLVAVRTRLADGKVTDENFLETDVWLKRAGKWQVAHVHYSQATPPAKPSWTAPAAKKP